MIGTVAEGLDMRVANLRTIEELDGTQLEDGRCSLWARLPAGLEAAGAALAIVADYVPMGIGQSLGRQISGNSLDNTLRMVRVHPTEWVLIDVRVQALAGGFGHGIVHLWAEDGTLLATASQSVIVRRWRAEFDEDGAASVPKDGGG